MINYVIINGVNSNTKNGLMINELPPISKPQMRTDIEEIDGRDGDIITKLGYSAYDKTITIGLWGTSYDVNDIIAFFNKEGIITFSNEPDKYYKFTMLDDFDIETLLRFKTASITFHCQPYKYPTEETPIEIEYEYIEQDNVESATLNNTNGDSHLDITLKGNTSQYTTTGKNLINIADIQIGKSWDNHDDTTRATIMFVPVEMNKDYTLVSSYTNSHITQIRAVFNMGSSGIARVPSSYPYTNADCTHVSIEILADTTFTSEMLNGAKIMLCYGSATIGDYEPYTGKNPSPNPSYPQPINVVSGDNEVVVCGKNLFDYNTYISNSTFKFSVIGGATLYRNGNIGNLTKWKIYDENNNYISDMSPFPSTGTFTIPNNAKYIEVNDDTGLTSELYIGYSSNTTYEPYQSQTYNINLGELELCKIGDYQDYFTKNSEGQWCKYNAIGKVVLDGSESWQSENVNTKINYYINLSSAVGSDTSTTCISNYFTGATGQQSYDSTTLTNIVGIGGSKRLRIRGTTFATKSDFTTWLSTHNTTLYYVLSTPYLSLIEDTTLINQLDNLEYAMSYEGQTNVSQVNNDKAFIMDLIAIKDGTDEVEVNNIGNTYSKPTIALEGTGDINIYLNGTQMLKATLTDKMTIDTTNLEAYNPDTMTLLNRQLVGDISKFTLSSGNNTIKVDGNLTKATITDYVRYL